MEIKEATNDMYEKLKYLANSYKNIKIDSIDITIFKKSDEEKYVVCVLDGSNSKVSGILNNEFECDEWIAKLN